MTGKLLVCRDCGAPLQIVCPTHGIAAAARALAERNAQAAQRQKPTARPIRREGQTRAAALRAMALNPSAEWHASRLAAAIGINQAYANVLLSEMAKAGDVTRVGRGRYVPTMTNRMTNSTNDEPHRLRQTAARAPGGGAPTTTSEETTDA